MFDITVSKDSFLPFTINPVALFFSKIISLTSFLKLKFTPFLFASSYKLFVILYIPPSGMYVP